MFEYVLADAVDDDFEGMLLVLIAIAIHVEVVYLILAEQRNEVLKLILLVKIFEKILSLLAHQLLHNLFRILTQLHDLFENPDLNNIDNHGCALVLVLITAVRLHVLEKFHDVVLTEHR